MPGFDAEALAWNAGNCRAGWRVPARLRRHRNVTMRSLSGTEERGIVESVFGGSGESPETNLGYQSSSLLSGDNGGEQGSSCPPRGKPGRGFFFYLRGEGGRGGGGGNGLAR